jgi:hypothetical protein
MLNDVSVDGILMGANGSLMGSNESASGEDGKGADIDDNVCARARTTGR